jgi:transcriptional regulator with XRE-family HTH domain
MKLTDLPPKIRNQLADKAGVSRGTLRHVAAGRRNVSSEAAITLERAAWRIGLDLRREDMARGCASCEFARRCRMKEKKK